MKRRRLSAKVERCVRDIKRSRARRPVNPFAVCRASIGNPRFQIALYARAPDGTKLKYIGGVKFARKGEPVRFATKGQARTIGQQLQYLFPVLRKFKLWAE